MSPQLCEEVIARSLQSHGLSAIPESGHDVRAWLEESLRPEVELAMGPDAADLTMSQLGPIVAYATVSRARATPVAPAPPISGRPTISFSPGAHLLVSNDVTPQVRHEDDCPTAAPPEGNPFGIEPITAPREALPRASDSAAPARPTRELGRATPAFVPKRPANMNHGAETLPPPPTREAPPRPRHTARPQPLAVEDAPSGLPRVLTATNAQDDLQALRRYLAGTAQVTHIPDLVGLLDALQEPDLIEPVVLIDCQRPSVHVSSVAALREDLPDGTTVVLWGADDLTWEQVDRERTPRCRWVRCSREATTEDVGSLCSMLIG